MTTTNAGEGGAQTELIRSNWDNAKTQNYTTVVVLGGVNDIRSDISEETIETNLEYIWQDALSLNMQVYALTIMPFGNSSSWTAARQSGWILTHG